MKTKSNRSEYLSTAEFKAHIKAICGISEAIAGAKHTDPCLVRSESQQINRPIMNADPTKPV